VLRPDFPFSVYTDMTERHLSPEEITPLAPSSEPMECRRCGMCCTMHQAFAAPDEIERMADYLGMTVTGWEEQYADPRFGFDIYRLVKHIDGACAFLGWDDDKLATCLVHEVKPGCCARWQAGTDKKECRAGMERARSGS